MTAKRPKILLAVTADMSLTLMRGFPEHLSNQGWEVHVVSTPGPLLASLSSQPHVHTHSLPMERQPSPLKDLVALALWIRLLRRVRPDIMSVGTPKAGLLGCIAGFLVGVPRRLYLQRGLRLETASGFLRRVFTLLEKLTIAASHDVVAVSPSLRGRAIMLGLVKDTKIRVLGSGSSNGIDPDAYLESNFSGSEPKKLKNGLGLVDDVPVIGFVGRLSADKGILILSEARRILSAAGVDHQLLVVGGNDPGQDSSALITPGINVRNAIITGHVTDLRLHYQLMDVLCLPTYREGFPNVVLEAGASGVPTVTTDATGAIDSVVDKVTGLIVEVGSSVQLATALEELLVNPIKRAAMGEAALDRIRESYRRIDFWERHSNYYAEGPLKARLTPPTRS